MRFWIDGILCLDISIHSNNCSSVKGLPPGLWTQQSSSPFRTIVTMPAQRFSSSTVGSANIILLKIRKINGNYWNKKKFFK